MALAGDLSQRLTQFHQILWVGLFSLMVAGPWLLPGYIFGTDFAGPRHFPFPDSATSFAGLQLALAIVALALPAEIVGKILILAVLFATGLSAYSAVPTGGFVPRAGASLVYMFNPFFYDRLAYGQLTVLGGYALLPWVLSSFRRLLLEPTAKRGLLLAASLVAVSILDVHMALIAAVLVTIVALAHVSLRRSDFVYLARFGRATLLAVIAALGASLYWLVPALLGRGPEAKLLASIGQGDLDAFSTAPDHSVGLLTNVLGLYGFWAERTDGFVSMKEFVAIWPLVLVGLLLLAALGAFSVARGDVAVSFEGSRSWVLGLVCAGAAAAVLDMGVSDPHAAQLVRWLDDAFPPYRGMRDAEKWAAVLALVYSQLISIGVVALLHRSKNRFRLGWHRELLGGAVVAMVLALPLYYGNGLLHGMHGQIQPSAYPAGWYEADRALAADSHPGRAVFLPWHGYMALSFVQNSNQVVASPAPLFFSIPVVASQDLEIPGVQPPIYDPDQAALARLVADGSQADWASALANRGIKYVLLAREVDWLSYTYLDHQTSLALIADFGSILVYRNLIWQPDWTG